MVLPRVTNPNKPIYNVYIVPLPSGGFGYFVHLYKEPNYIGRVDVIRGLRYRTKKPIETTAKLENAETLFTAMTWVRAGVPKSWTRLGKLKVIDKHELVMWRQRDIYLNRDQKNLEEVRASWYAWATHFTQMVHIGSLDEQTVWIPKSVVKQAPAIIDWLEKGYTLHTEEIEIEYLKRSAYREDEWMDE